MARKDDVHEFVKNGCQKSKANEPAKDIKIDKNNKITYIPEKTALVYTTLTGNVEVIIGPHFPKFNFPWRKDFQYIDLSEKTTDYKARVFHTKNFIKIQTDLYIKTEIINPRKYYLESQNFETTLFNVVQEKVMNYFQNTTKDELDKSHDKINLSILGSNSFSEIESKYGVRVTSIGTTDFHYPDLLDDAKIQAENKMRHDENLREQQRRLELQNANREIQIFAAETENLISAEQYNNYKTLIKGLSEKEINAIQELIKWKTIGQVKPESLTIIESQDSQSKKRRR